MLNPSAEPMLPTPYRVLKVGRETADTFTLTLAPSGGEPGFTFAPGQFNMLYAFGVGEVPISISGDPDRPETLVHTVRAVGAVTRAICGLKKGGRPGGAGSLRRALAGGESPGPGRSGDCRGLGSGPFAARGVPPPDPPPGIRQPGIDLRGPDAGGSAYSAGNWSAGGAASISGCTSPWTRPGATGGAMWGW